MKLAFVNQRYGTEVNGGSEYYTRKLAEQLSDAHEIDILTTKAKDHTTWKNEYKRDFEQTGNITVRRFGVRHPRKSFAFRLADKMNRMWPKKSWVEKMWLRQQGPYAPELITYIREHAADYDYFVFFTYLYYPVVYGIPQVAEKAVLVPTAHDEPYIHMDVFRQVFEQPRGLIYLTHEEQQMSERLFPAIRTKPAIVLGCGVDTPESADGEAFRKKYRIFGEFLIYTGRVDEAKGCGEMFAYFREMCKTRQNLSLVVLGKAGMHIPNEDDIHYLGFVSEEDKANALAAARALILPSKYESLSLSVLEAMKMGTPVIVNAACPVLKGHCSRSGGGFTYENAREFLDAADHLFTDDYETVCANAARYVRQQYDWQKVVHDFEDFMQQL